VGSRRLIIRCALVFKVRNIMLSGSSIASLQVSKYRTVALARAGRATRWVLPRFLVLSEMLVQLKPSSRESMRGVCRRLLTTNERRWRQVCWNSANFTCSHRLAWVELSSSSPTLSAQRKSKGKKMKEYLYIAPFIYYVYLKALRYGSDSFTCKYTMPVFSL